MAAAAHILLHASSVIPMLGASGAIAGVLGAYLVLFPANRVLVILLRFPIWVPAIVAIGMWVVLQVVGGFATPTEGGGRCVRGAHRRLPRRRGRRRAVPPGEA